VKRWKGNDSSFPSWAGRITACRQAFTGPQLRRDWQGGGLRWLRLGSRVAMCLSFHWNNPRHKGFIPNRKKITEDAKVMGPGPSVYGKERESPKSNVCPEFWLSRSSHFVLHLSTLKTQKLRGRWVRSSTETYSNLLNVHKETQIPAPAASFLEKTIGICRAVKAIVQNYRKQSPLTWMPQYEFRNLQFSIQF